MVMDTVTLGVVWRWWRWWWWFEGAFHRSCLTSAGGVPERGRGLGQSLV